MVTFEQSPFELVEIKPQIHYAIDVDLVVSHFFTSL